ncbi:MAG: flippase-like domain-containing protein [Chloroflexota bacterium]|nr:MAG: flippase-like domain-containing protein [Chloroflexota bacterium]
MERSSTAKRLQFWIGMVVSIACLAAVFIFVRPADIVEALGNTRYELWLLAAVSLIAFLALRAVRWRFMLNSGLGPARRVPYGKVFNIQNIGYMLTNILPFRLGDVARAVLIGNVPSLSISRGLSTMVAERVFDLAFIVILFPFTLSGVPEVPPAVIAIVRVAGAGVLVAMVVLVGAANQREQAGRLTNAFLRRIPRIDAQAWSRRFEDLLLGLDSLTRFTDAVVLLLLSIVIWVPIVAGYYLGLRAVNLDVTLQQATFVVCIAAFSVTAPSSPGQVGVFEASVTFAIAGILGLPDAEAASFAVLYHVVNYLVLGVLGIIAISRTGETFSNVVASARSLVRSEAVAADSNMKQGS